MPQTDGRRTNSDFMSSADTVKQSLWEKFLHSPLHPRSFHRDPYPTVDSLRRDQALAHRDPDIRTGNMNTDSHMRYTRGHPPVW